MDAEASRNTGAIWIHLPTLGISLSATDLLGDAFASALAADDLCWRIARDDWMSRRPPRWRWRRWAAWRAEFEQLRTERDAIRAAGRRCGLVRTARQSRRPA